MTPTRNLVIAALLTSIAACASVDRPHHGSTEPRMVSLGSLHVIALHLSQGTLYLDPMLREEQSTVRRLIEEYIADCDEQRRIHRLAATGKRAEARRLAVDIRARFGSNLADGYRRFIDATLSNANEPAPTDTSTTKPGR